jgi:hypothetical protein
MKRILKCLLLPLAGCLDPRYMTPFGYLGIPEQESYPNTKAAPVESARDRYGRISEVADAPYSDYVSAVSNRTAKFVARAHGHVYFSTEMTGDIEQNADVRAWVTVLYRWKARMK